MMIKPERARQAYCAKLRHCTSQAPKTCIIKSKLQSCEPFEKCAISLEHKVLLIKEVFHEFLLRAENIAGPILSFYEFKIKLNF